ARAGTGLAAKVAGGDVAPEGRPVAWGFQAVAQHAPPGDCLKLGMVLAERAPRVALLAMGDACARPAREAPGVPDLAAQEYDEDVAEALAAADARWLARLDPARDNELVVAGRAAWQVLAGAAACGDRRRPPPGGAAWPGGPRRGAPPGGSPG